MAHVFGSCFKFAHPKRFSLMGVFLTISQTLGRPLGYLIFSLMTLIRDPIYEYYSKGFRGQPRTSLIGTCIPCARLRELIRFAK